MIDVADTLTELEKVMLAQLPTLAQLHVDCPADLRPKLNDFLEAYLYAAGLVEEMVTP